LSLTPTEFRLLWELVRRPGYVLSRSELTRTCKGSENAVQARTIDAHIKSIRRKLRDRAHLIETVHGVGYRFQEMEVTGKSLAAREP
jgi:DNA-binding response OmpR family regulator